MILQADVQKGSFIAAWDAATGKPLWKTERADEISTWGTPTIARTSDGRDVLVTNGTKIAATIPHLANSSGRSVQTPDHDRHAGGRQRPCLRDRRLSAGASDLCDSSGGEGDISLQKGQESNRSIAWSNMTEGTYIRRRCSTTGIFSR